MSEVSLEWATRPTRAVLSWRPAPDADAFPYDEVVDEFQRVGKHFVAPELLEALDGVRAALPGVPGSAAGRRRLERFLDDVLDKRDGRYDYVTYLALDLLELPEPDQRDLSRTASAERRRDLLMAQLVTDALRFELAAADGRTPLLPRLRPAPWTVAKRCRLGLQTIAPALWRLGLPEPGRAGPSLRAAALACARVEAAATQDERMAVRLSMLPVDVIHDEWMFLRVLQSFETTFAVLVVHLLAAVDALVGGLAGRARERVAAAEVALREAMPLFSVLGTMRVDAFRTFRQYTEGASAIQSRGYKLVESLCRRPDPERLDSIAFLSVPEVRERVLAGQVTLEEALRAARASGPATGTQLRAVEDAMRRFAGALMQWRRAHYRLAVRMLGDQTGTGYTEGTPYLDAVRRTPVFGSGPE